MKTEHTYFVTIDMNFPKEYQVKAKTKSEAKKKAWVKFQKRMPKQCFTTDIEFTP